MDVLGRINMSENVFEGFKKYKDVDEVILEKYKKLCLMSF